MSTKYAIPKNKHIHKSLTLSKLNIHTLLTYGSLSRENYETELEIRRVISYLVERSCFHADGDIEEDFQHFTAQINFLIIQLPLFLLGTTQCQVKHFYQICESVQFVSKSRPEIVQHTHNIKAYTHTHVLHFVVQTMPTISRHKLFSPKRPSVPVYSQQTVA